jgi:hypothetical protein
MEQRQIDIFFSKRSFTNSQPPPPHPPPSARPGNSGPRRRSSLTSHHLNIQDHVGPYFMRGAL